MKRTKAFVLLIMLINFTVLLSQGLPPVKHYSPLDYRAENQNWAISQSPDKVMYVANNQGLLEYNGGGWNFYSSPNETILRSVSVVGDRIYTGCYMEFGFWQKNETGLLNYTSLSEDLKGELEPDEEFWNILNIDEFVLFQSLKRIYIYDLRDNSVSKINSTTTIPKIFSRGQIVYYQKIDEGVYKIENGIEILVYDDEVVRSDEVVGLIADGESLFFIMRNRGIYEGGNSTLRKLNTPSEDLLSKISIYSALQLQNGEVALGTISHGLIILDNQWKLVLQLNENKGLGNNTVLSILEDEDNNLWLGLDNGISLVNLTSPFRVYADKRGIVGSVYTSAIKENMMFLGTNQGLFARNVNDIEDFKLVEGTKGQVWSLDQIGNTLFCGHHDGTFIIEGKEATKISDIPGTWKIAPLENNPDLLLQGSYSGLYILEQRNGQWSLRNKIKGFDHSARFFEVLDSTIFVNHEYKGIFNITTDPDLLETRTISHDTTLIGANSGMTKYKGDLLYSNKDGIFKYDWESMAFIKDRLLSRVYDEAKYVSGKLVVDDKSDYLWIFTDSNINYVSEGSLASDPLIRSVPLTINVRNSISGYESVTAINGTGKYLFGTASGYITVDLGSLDIPSFQAEINRINLIDKRTRGDKNKWLDPNNSGQLENRENHLEISYYTPLYRKFLVPEYQYQLVGLYDAWSDWTTQTSISFENLPFGDYEFRVRSKIGGKISENTATYNFQIAKPWYISNAMLALYGFLGVLGALLIHYAYWYYYRRKQRLQSEASQKEMELIRLQNDKDIIKLKNDQLKEDFRNKNNELAASTMSIIKKNQLLSKVKQQLASADQTDSNKEIIRIIDRTLNQNDDWELFKEAFNNTDREFLKKLEKNHPNLSPNDIRLCAYLRLNLVSKEIAQLLNISPRSVEIKRYRLRKKLNLTHDENLVNYILKL